MSIFGEVQPAVKKETGHVAVYTAIGAVLMWVIFGILHGVMPEKVPFDYTVFLGGIGGGLIAVLNFFLMGLTVQKVAARIFGILHGVMPEKVPFDYTVFLGGIGGGLIAVLNFFLMGLTVQKVAASTDEDAARMKMKASYSQRMLLQMLWVVAAIALPCFQFVAGILPLLFPSLGIKLHSIIFKKK